MGVHTLTAIRTERHTHKGALRAAHGRVFVCSRVSEHLQACVYDVLHTHIHITHLYVILKVDFTTVLLVRIVHIINQRDSLHTHTHTQRERERERTQAYIRRHKSDTAALPVACCISHTHASYL